MFSKTSSARTVRLHYKLILLSCLVILLYLPTLHSGFFIFDDFGIVAAIKAVTSNETLTFLWTAEGRYWRPFIMSSFLLDVKLLGANSTLMHLHNILIHAANTLLVFFAVRIFSGKTNRNNDIALLAAAVFAAHPINTEAVAWIAARTDLYATLFSMAGVCLYARSSETNNSFFSWGAALLFLLGSWSKETGVPLFLAAAIGASVLTKEKKPLFKPEISVVKKISAALPYLLTGFAYFLLRQSAFQSVDQSLSKVVAISEQQGPSFLDQTAAGLTALGFYVKKTFIPTPLNFAIDSVAQYYLWLGIATLAIFFTIIVMRKKDSVLLLIALFSITPALLNAIFNIAWTPYAERYLYLPTAMLCSFLGVRLTHLNRSNNIQKIAGLVIVIVFLAITLQRNLAWQDYSAILADAVRKSPDNTSLRVNYAIVIEEKDPQNARDQLLQAKELAPNQQVIRRVMSAISLNTMKDPELARQDLDIFFQGGQEPSKETLHSMIKVNLARIGKEQDKNFKWVAIKDELAKSYLKLYNVTKQPPDLFQGIQYLQRPQDISAAKTILERIISESSHDQHKKEARRYLLQHSGVST